MDALCKCMFINIEVAKGVCKVAKLDILCISISQTMGFATIVPLD